jgi:tetratricopeptide (TPR) repeat protein/gas vesicle protein
MRQAGNKRTSTRRLRPDQILLLCVAIGVMAAALLSALVSGAKEMSLLLLAGFLVGLVAGVTVATSDVLRRADSSSRNANKATAKQRASEEDAEETPSSSARPAKQAEDDKAPATAVAASAAATGVAAATTSSATSSAAHKQAAVATAPPSATSASQAEASPLATTATASQEKVRDTHQSTTEASNAAQAAQMEKSARLTTPSSALVSRNSKYSHFDYDDFVKRLLGTGDPIAELKLIAQDIAHREQAWTGTGHWKGGRAQAERSRLAVLALGEEDVPVVKADEPDPEQTLIPSGVELFLAHQLQDAGLFDKDVELPRMHAVRPHSSGMLYLRVEQEQVAYGAMLNVLRIEAALNAVRFVSRYFDDLDKVSEEDCCSLQQRITSSIVAQAAPINQPYEPKDDGDPDGEWAVRHGISKSIESFQLPFRLVASFRTNVVDGNVAIEVTLTPADVFPSTVYVPYVGLTKSSKQMRREAASTYGLRLALLLAAAAFRTSKRIQHVWVAGVLDTATHHSCYYSIDFDRWRFSKVDLEQTDDLESTLHSFCPTMRMEDGFLRPVAQTFSLSEDRFCPHRRFESVSLSTRRLAKPFAEALGTDHVSGLAIDEADKREALADDIIRNLANPSDKEATTRDVHAILTIAGDDPDPNVRSAAERTAEKLVRGTISDDPLAVAEEFVSGDVLSRATVHAQEALAAHDATTAIHLLDEALATADSEEHYADSNHIVWRYFATFVDRALYNRLDMDDGRTVMLVPRSYFNAHLLDSIALISANRVAQAADHARLLVRIAPLDTRSRLQLVRCLENMGKDDDAIAELKLLLEVAHDPQSIGTAYYRMAFFQWKAGNYLAAQACYALAMRFLPGSAPTVAIEMATLSMQGNAQGATELQRNLSEHEISTTLQSYGIPEAPTERIARAFFECARASLDAEIFPVARMFMSTLAAFAPDDVTVGVMRSLEDGPGTPLIHS